MNNRFRTLLVFMLGVASGAVGAVLIVKDKYRQLAADEIQEYKEFADIQIKHIETTEKERTNINEVIMREQVKDLRKEFGSDVGTDDKEIQEPTQWPEEKAVESTKKVLKRYNALIEKKNLEEIMAERGLTPENSDHPTDDQPEQYNPIEPSDIPIHMINAKDFNEGLPEYDALSIFYYAGDDTLADENNMIIPRPVDIVGPDALESFDKGEDPNVVYVRNHNISTDFEILRTMESYAEQYVRSGGENAPKKESLHKNKKAVVIHGNEVEVRDLPPKVSRKKRTDGEE
jgi:hypothetical protein